VIRSNREAGKPSAPEGLQARAFGRDPASRQASWPADLSAAPTGRRHGRTDQPHRSPRSTLPNGEPYRHGAALTLRNARRWFDCAINAKLRACDRVRLTVSDVAHGGVLGARSTVIQQKTGRPVPFDITEPTREALAAWLAVRGRRADDWLFPSRSRHGDHISTRQYARLVDRWVKLVYLELGAYGTHSLRRTKVALVYKNTGNLRASQLLLGHRKLRAPSGISASRSTTRSNCRSSLRSDAEGAAKIGPSRRARWVERGRPLRARKGTFRRWKLVLRSPTRSQAAQ
jgi:hypothetical protein